MTASSEAPGFMIDPIGTICDVVATVEPALSAGVIIGAVEAVTVSRPAQRRLARNLYENPNLLVSGRTEGLPMVDSLIRQLREHGAETLVQPCCGGCGKPQRRMTTHNEAGLRICVTCENRASGRFTPQPCTRCGKVITPHHRDRNGGPRCEWCPPEADVDHVGVICDIVTAATAHEDRTALRDLVCETVRQPARRRQLAWDLQDNPELLNGQAASGSATLRRLVRILSREGIKIDAPRCPFCGHAGRVLESMREGRPCCPSCYHATRRTPCTRCERELPVSARTAEGLPLCWECTRHAEFNYGTCGTCGDYKAIATRRNGVLTCFDCRKMPVAQCSTCGATKPCHFVDTASPRCVPCSKRGKEVPCFRCGRNRVVNTRDSDGNPLCASCSQRREHCGLCDRLLPVYTRVDSESRCWTCFRRDPALFRNCANCNAFGSIRYAGLCERCTATYKLTEALADATGAVPAHLQPVHDALIASPPKSLLNWLHRTNATTLLSQLTSMQGPITHATLDELSPARGAGWLRHVLIANGALPERDEYLHALERWLQATLPEIPDPEDRRLLTRYLTWSHLRRLRTAKAPTTPGQIADIRSEVRSIVNLLIWLRNRDTALQECVQADLDQWCLRGGRMPLRPRKFVAWCVERKHLPTLAIPAAPVRPDRHLLEDDHRWSLANHLLHSDTEDVVNRVAGLLVVLYGQSASRIVGLKVDDVIDNGNQVQILLGVEPVVVPTPLDGLIRQLTGRRQGKAAVGRPVRTDWLFPGGNPGRPLHPQAMARRLRKAGVSVRDGRNTALIHMAATLPTKVLSDLLGISTYAAAAWSVLAGAGNADYAATVARREAASQRARE